MRPVLAAASEKDIMTRGVERIGESREGSCEMVKVATSVRCVPRFGYDFTDVRMVSIDVPRDFGHAELHDALNRWFRSIGLEDAVFAIETDDNGYFAVVNDEVFERPWGESVGL